MILLSSNPSNWPVFSICCVIFTVFVIFVLLYNYVKPFTDFIHDLFGWDKIKKDDGHGHDHH